MTQTHKKKVKHNLTKKNVKMCPIGLKPFEEEFSKKTPSSQLKKSSAEKKKLFVSEQKSCYNWPRKTGEN